MIDKDAINAVAAPPRGRLIGFTGPKGCGKSDGAARALMLRGWKRVKIAQAIKDAAFPIFSGLGLDPYECTEGELKDRALPELGGKTPRDVMIFLGYGMRKEFRADIWCLIQRPHIEAALARGERLLLDDVREQEEADMIRDLGGIIVEVVRPDCTYDGTEGENRLLPDRKIVNIGTIEAFRADVIATFDRQVIE